MNEEKVGDFFDTSNPVVKDEWKVREDHYRLVYFGQGPMCLQEKQNGEWKEVSPCYRWGVVTARLSNRIENYLEDDGEVEQEGR